MHDHRNVLRCPLISNLTMRSPFVLESSAA